MEESVTSAYTVRTGSFEGPLDLLLSLIENRKFFINEISLSKVTDDYIEYIRSVQETPTGKHITDVSYFVLIAATLILIKSKSLLPNLTLTEEETEKISDLENRLKIYQIIKTATLDVDTHFGTKIIWRANDRTWNKPIFSPDPMITTENIAASINDVLMNVPKKKEDLPEIEVKKIINIDEMINNLTERIEKAVSMSFREFSKSHDSGNDREVRLNVIVSFLAMLELVREGIIDAIQENSQDDIAINKQSISEN